MKIFSTRTIITSVIGVIAFSLMTGFAINKPKSKKMKKEGAISATNIDNTVKAGDDFYMYANGGWLKNHPIPSDQSAFGSFEALAEENYKQLRSIMEAAAKDKTAKVGSIKQKIGDFYKSGMDTVKIEKAGINAIKAELNQVDAIKTQTDLLKGIADFHTAGVGALFNFGSGQDDENSNNVIAQLYQGGLGLPDRDYYTSDDARSKEIRAEYVKHITKMFVLMGENNTTAAQNADIVMKIETQLAEISSTRTELRDPVKNYNKMDMAGLKKISAFDWDLYFSTLGLKNTKEINVGQTKFFGEMAKIFTSVPVDQWKVYLKWNVVREAASCLSSKFDKEHFAFYGTVLSGVKEMKPRWKRVMNNTSGNLGEAVGQLYVAKYFPPEAKKRMIELISNLKLALKERIEKLTWMSQETKKQAVAKLEKINVKVGYPDKWIDYSTLKITKDSYFENIMAASRFYFKRDIDKIGKPVDRMEWGMTPQTVNAYYSPNMNEIVFPAAILQEPFFFLKADDAVNYGAIGVVIGHEMTHGFDDQGRQYDKEGNLHDWWTKEDATNFEKQTQVIVDHYNSYKILDSLHVDGKLTLGENIADMGGITVAYAALQKALQGKKTPEKIDGFTIDQRFFLSYAQVWRQNMRDKEAMRRLKEDVHSPHEARVNALLFNVPQFYKAFNILPTDKRFIPEKDRAVIW